MKQFIKKVKKKVQSASSSGTRESSPNPAESSVGASGHPTNTPQDKIQELTNSSETYEQISEWLEQGLSPLRDVSKATSIISPLKGTCLVAIRGVQLARNVRNYDKAWGDFLRTAQGHADLISLRLDRLEAKSAKAAKDERLVKAAQDYAEAIREILVTAQKAMSAAREGTGGTAGHFAQTNMDLAIISELRVKEGRSFNIYQRTLSDITFSTALEIEATINEIQEEVGQLDQINFALGEGAEADALRSSMQHAYGTNLDSCEPGTRVDVLTKIRQWARDHNDRQQIFWLRDAGGTGKSTIAVTMANEWAREKRLAGRFFFSPNVDINQRIKFFCRIVAADIACQFPLLRRQIELPLSELPWMESRMDFVLQFRRVILGPLQEQIAGRAVCLVVDALDNCEVQDRVFFLKTILIELPKFPLLKVLITSRELQDIADRLANSPLVCGQGVQLLNVNSPPQNDISVYIHSKLQSYPLKDRQRIIAHSQGLFIWAATFCRALLQTRLGARLLNNLAHQAVTGSIDQLYLDILKQASVDKNAEENLTLVLQVIISAFQPVSSNTIRDLLPAVEQVDDLVRDLAGVIKDGHPDRPLKVLHPTFREFIASNEDRANGFLVQINPSHSLLGLACLEVMEYLLKFDMLGISHLGGSIPFNKEVKDIPKAIERHVPMVLRYAASYWAHHIAAAESAWEEWARVASFLRNHLCHWLELMSWRGALDQSLQGLSQLALRARKQTLGNDDIAVVQHAFQFLIKNRLTIETSALHAYTVPVALAPKGSSLFRDFDPPKSLPTLRAARAGDQIWETQLSLIGHDDHVMEVKVSPNGNHAITLGQDGSIRLWDTNTAESTLLSYNAERDTVLFGSTAEFSADGTTAAVGYKNHDLRLWDTRSCRPIWTSTVPLEMRGGPAPSCVRFSPTQPHIAYAVDYTTPHQRSESILRLYDVKTGDRHDKTLILRPASTTFAISPDGTRSIHAGRVDDASRDCIITLVDLVSLQQLVQLKAGAAEGTTISYSPDGTRAVTSCDYDQREIPLTLLDCRTGEMIEMEVVDENQSYRATFEPRGRRFVSVLNNEKGLIVWDGANGRAIRTIPCHDGFFKRIWFSSDGMRIAALSSVQTVKVYGIDTGKEHPTILKGYTGKSVSAALSHDWSKLLVVRSYQEVCVFDTNINGFGFHSPDKPTLGTVSAWLFSNQSTALITFRGIIFVWTLENGTFRLRTKLEDGKGHGHIAVTPDETKIISTYGNPDILFYSSRHFERVQNILEDEDKRTRGGSISFSPERDRMAISTTSCTQVWEYKTGVSIWKSPEGGLGDSVTFSMDGIKLAGSTSKATYVYSLTDGTAICRVDQAMPYGIMTFSPSADRLVTLMAQLEVWDITGNMGLHLADYPARQNFESTHHLGMVAGEGEEYVIYGSQVWKLDRRKLIAYNEPVIPPALRHYRHSLLTYKDGWIYSALPYRAILPIPADVVGRGLGIWSVGNAVLIGTETGEPILLDCSTFVSAE
ncbi:SubName: Full=Related to NACHT and WD40 domain protein-Penicillium marneffei {ECO:0000313/EMBL:CCA73419.1} [Serendipita indica DSM 11827]|nr:SubName: Full=Related to NACHT and WD40 domain protein-Penicillium marneffei {ECO:0000313/EMBL:CCA73419.1} [Serendipita indica DSM 11827]